MNKLFIVFLGISILFLSGCNNSGQADNDDCLGSLESITGDETIISERNSIIFEPGASGSKSIDILNKNNKEMQVAIFLEGDDKILSGFDINSALLDFKSSDKSKTFTYNYKLPSSLEPGSHDVNITMRELLENGEETNYQFRVNVLYPGKYASSELSFGKSSNNKVEFVVPVSNLGTQTIVNARGIIDIYSASNQKIATISTNSQSIESGKKIELIGVWEENVGVGAYAAKANAIYDGEVTEEVTKVFKVESSGVGC